MICDSKIVIYFQKSKFLVIFLHKNKKTENNLCLFSYSKYYIITIISFAHRQAAALRPLVAAIVVKFYFHVRLCKLHIARQSELHVTDVQPTLYPLCLIVCLYAKNLLCFLINALSVIQVLGSEEHRQAVFLDHISGICEQEV